MQQYSQLIFIAVIIVAFYFLLIRPQQQQAKQQREMVASLEPGVEIMTVGGIYATVVAIDGDRIRVSVADGSELEIAKRAVASVVAHRDSDEDDDIAEDEPAIAGDGTADEAPEDDAPDA